MRGALHWNGTVPSAEYAPPSLVSMASANEARPSGLDERQSRRLSPGQEPARPAANRVTLVVHVPIARDEYEPMAGPRHCDVELPPSGRHLRWRRRTVPVHRHLSLHQTGEHHDVELPALRMVVVGEDHLPGDRSERSEIAELQVVNLALEHQEVFSITFVRTVISDPVESQGVDEAMHPGERGVGLNLNRVGSLHLLKPEQVTVARWWEVAAAEDAHAIVKRMEQVAGLAPIKRPRTTDRSLAHRVIAQALAMTINDRHTWDARSLFHDTSGDWDEDAERQAWISSFPTALAVTRRGGLPRVGWHGERGRTSGPSPETRPPWPSWTRSERSTDPTVSGSVS